MTYTKQDPDLPLSIKGQIFLSHVYQGAKGNLFTTPVKRQKAGLSHVQSLQIKEAEKS